MLGPPREIARRGGACDGKRRTRHRKLLAAVAAAAVWGIAAARAEPLPAAATAVFVQGASDAWGAASAFEADGATIRSGQPEANLGAAATLIVGRTAGGGLHRALLRFNLSSLQGRVRSVRGARLVLTVATTDVVGPGALTTPTLVTLTRLRPPNRWWVEGTQATAEAQTGAVCWAAPGWGVAGWAGEPGCGLAGTDIESTADAQAARSETRWTAGETWELDMVDPVALAAVQAWIDRPEENSGWLLRSPSLEQAPPALSAAVIQFWSDDAPVPTVRPRLEIDFEPADATRVAFVRDGSTWGPPAPAAMLAPAAALEGARPDLAWGGEPVVPVGYGAAAGAEAGPWRVLVRFDLTPLRGVLGRLTGAELRLTTADVALGNLAAAFDLTVDRVLAANASWHEGAARGSSELGSATWGWRSLGEALWAGGGGLATRGVDVAAQPMAQRWVRPSAVGPGTFVRVRLLDLAAIEDWVAHPEHNGGLRLMSETLEARGAAIPGAPATVSFHANEAATAAARPTLAITWVPVGRAADRWLDAE